VIPSLGPDLRSLKSARVRNPGRIDRAVGGRSVRLEAPTSLELRMADAGEDRAPSSRRAWSILPAP
jgi:hypothetical protein